MSLPPLSSVTLGLPTGERVVLFVGDLIGRLWSAELQLNDPRISEVHAYISLRAGELRLMRLRGHLSLHGMAVEAVVLTVGQHIELAEGLSLEVLALQVASGAPALVVDGEPHPMVASRCSLTLSGQVVAGTLQDAAAWIWSDGTRWSIQVPGGPIQALQGTVLVEGRSLSLTSAELQAIEAPPTLGGGQRLPLRIQARFDSVIIEQVGGKSGRIIGNAARLLTCLAELDGPAHWELVAREVWPTLDDRERLRHRWDRGLWSLRRMLLRAELPTDLVQTGGGTVELVLMAHDQLQVSG